MTLSAGFRQQNFQGQIPRSWESWALRSHEDSRVPGGWRDQESCPSSASQTVATWKGAWGVTVGLVGVTAAAGRKGLGGDTWLWSRPEGGVGPAGTSEVTNPECRKGRACALRRSEGGSAGAAIGTTEHVCSRFPLAFFSQSHPESRKVPDQTDGHTHPPVPHQCTATRAPTPQRAPPVRAASGYACLDPSPQRAKVGVYFWGEGDTLPWGRRDSKGRVLRS